MSIARVASISLFALLLLPVFVYAGNADCTAGDYSCSYPTKKEINTNGAMQTIICMQGKSCSQAANGAIVQGKCTAQNVCTATATTEGDKTKALTDPKAVQEQAAKAGGSMNGGSAEPAGTAGMQGATGSQSGASPAATSKSGACEYCNDAYAGGETGEKVIQQQARDAQAAGDPKVGYINAGNNGSISGGTPVLRGDASTIANLKQIQSLGSIADNPSVNPAKGCSFCDDRFAGTNVGQQPVLITGDRNFIQSAKAALSELANWDYQASRQQGLFSSLFSDGQANWTPSNVSGFGSSGGNPVTISQSGINGSSGNVTAAPVSGNTSGVTFGMPTNVPGTTLSNGPPAALSPAQKTAWLAAYDQAKSICGGGANCEVFAQQKATAAAQQSGTDLGTNSYLNNSCNGFGSCVSQGATKAWESVQGAYKGFSDALFGSSPQDATTGDIPATQYVSLQASDLGKNAITSDASSVVVPDENKIAEITGELSTYCPDPSCPNKYKEGGMSLATGGRYDKDAFSMALQRDLAEEYGCGYGAGKTCYALVESNGKQAIVEVNDNGPLARAADGSIRKGDLSYAAADYFGIKNNSGVLKDASITLLRGDSYTPGPVESVSVATLQPTSMPESVNSLSAAYREQLAADQQLFTASLQDRADKAQRDLYWAQAQPAIVRQFSESDFVPTSGNITPTAVNSVSGAGPTLSAVNESLDAIQPPNAVSGILPQVTVTRDSAFSDIGAQAVPAVSSLHEQVKASPDLPDPVIEASPFGLSTVQARDAHAFDFGQIASQLPLGRFNPALGSNDNIAFSSGGGFTAGESTNDVMSGDISTHDQGGGSNVAATNLDYGTDQINHPAPVLGSTDNTHAPSTGGFTGENYGLNTAALEPGGERIADTSGDLSALDVVPPGYKGGVGSAIQTTPAAEIVASQESVRTSAHTSSSANSGGSESQSDSRWVFYNPGNPLGAPGIDRFIYSGPGGNPAEISSWTNLPSSGGTSPFITQPGDGSTGLTPDGRGNMVLNQASAIGGNDTSGLPAPTTPDTTANLPATKPDAVASDATPGAVKGTGGTTLLDSAKEAAKGLVDKVEGLLGITPADVRSSDSKLEYGDGAGVQPSVGGSDIQTPAQQENNARYAAENTLGERVRAVPLTDVAPAEVTIETLQASEQESQQVKAATGKVEEVALVPAPDAVAANEAETAARQGTLNQVNPGEALGIKGANGTQSGESGKAAVTGLTPPPAGAEPPAAGPAPKSPGGGGAPSGGGNATGGANGGTSNGKGGLGDIAGALKSAKDIVKGLMGGGGGSGSGSAATPTTSVTANPATVLATPVASTQFTPAVPLTPAPKILVVANPNPVTSNTSSTISWQAQWDDAQASSTTRECAVADVHGKTLADHAGVSDSVATPALVHAAYFVIGCKQSGGKLGSTMILVRVKGDSVTPDAPPSALPSYQSTSGASTAGADLEAALYGSVPSAGAVPASNTQQPQQQPKNVACDPNSSKYFDCLTGKMQFSDNLF